MKSIQECFRLLLVLTLEKDFRIKFFLTLTQCFYLSASLYT